MTKPTKLFPCRDEVAIDDNHIGLIASLAMCAKPKSILELGIGSGATTNALLEAIKYNGNGAMLTCVDNFLDWDGIPPADVENLPAHVINQSEREFVTACQERFDFIVSDADHDHSHEWCQSTMDLLNNDGIAVFHDVTSGEYPNLWNVVYRFKDMRHVIFNQSSRDDERCHRGLLVVFK